MRQVEALQIGDWRVGRCSDASDPESQDGKDGREACGE
jgi:hypothetical protein